MLLLTRQLIMLVQFRFNIIRLKQYIIDSIKWTPYCVVEDLSLPHKLPVHKPFIDLLLHRVSNICFLVGGFPKDHVSRNPTLITETRTNVFLSFSRQHTWGWLTFSLRIPHHGVMRVYNQLQTSLYKQLLLNLKKNVKKCLLVLVLDRWKCGRLVCNTLIYSLHEFIALTTQTLSRCNLSICNYG